MVVLTRPAPAARRRPDAAPLRPRAVLRLPMALAVGAAAGLVYSVAFPATGVWILAFVGAGGLIVALRGRGFWTGALVGLAFGAAFWFPLIDWITLFLGPVPLLALGTLQALLVAGGAGLVALAQRSIALLRPTAWGRIGVAPLLIAAAWTTREVVAGTWPYGGFAWGRFAESQATGPFAFLVAWFGIPGLGFVLVWLTAVVIAIVAEPRSDLRGMRRERGTALLRGLLAAAVLPALLLVGIPHVPITVRNWLRVAAVQPNTHAGYFDPRNDPTANLRATVAATVPVIGRGAQLVVWPEGAAMFDPFHDAGVRQELDAVANAVQAPLVTGAITERGGREYNTSLVWEGGRGITGLYDKVHPVPFAEYVPDRAFWTPLAPDLFKLIGRDYTIGTRSPVVQTAGTRVGVDICFDIVDDGLILGSVQDGAEVLVAQTNNADFGTTDEHQQQLAIARMRAIETGRAVVTASTVASTTLIGPDGVTIATTKPFVAQALIGDVPLSTGTTPAVAFGVPLAATIAILGGVLPLIAAALARPLRRRRTFIRGSAARIP